jgi:hypothetical protein
MGSMYINVVVKEGAEGASHGGSSSQPKPSTQSGSTSSQFPPPLSVLLHN